MENEVIPVELTALSYGGGAIGSVTSDGGVRHGKRALIPFTIPGESVFAKIEIEKERLIHATLNSIVTESPDRTLPKCSVFGQCGGCDLQHMSIERQQTEKLLMISSMLKKQAGITVEQGVTLVNNNLPAYDYRSRVTLHIDLGGQIGFYRPGSGDVVEFDHCHIASQRLNTAIFQAKPFFSKFSDIASSVVFEEHSESVCLVIDLRDSANLPVNDLKGRFKSLLLQFPETAVRKNNRVLLENRSFATQQSGHFSQVNKYGNEILVNIVSAKIPSGTTNITEFYAGAGNLTFPLAKTGAQVSAVEVDPVLVEAGQELAGTLPHGDRVIFTCQSAEKYVKLFKLSNCVVLDPPRSGAAEVVAA